MLQTTDRWATAYRERKRELMFANKTNANVYGAFAMTKHVDMSNFSTPLSAWCIF